MPVRKQLRKVTCPQMHFCIIPAMLAFNQHTRATYNQSVSGEQYWKSQECKKTPRSCKWSYPCQFSFFLSFFLSFCLSVCLSVCLSFFLCVCSVCALCLFCLICFLLLFLLFIHLLHTCTYMIACSLHINASKE